MKLEAKNLTRSPALVFFLLMGVQNAYSLSIILSRAEFGWNTFSSTLTSLMPFVIAAALFFRIPNLLYLPFAVNGAASLCWLIVKFANLFLVGTAGASDVLLVLMYLVQIALYGVLAYMTFRLGELKMLWFLPLLLHLAYTVGYRIYIYLMIGGGIINPSFFINLILTVPAYGFLGRWLAYPYKKSYYRKQNQISNTSEQEENIHA